MLPFKEDGFFWFTFSGEISLVRLAQAHERFVQHPDYVPGIDELLDFSQTSISHMKKPEIDMVRQYLIDRALNDEARFVMVVNTQAEFGLGRMISVLLEDVAPVDRRAFYELHDALEWLRPGRSEALLEARAQKLAEIQAEDT